MKRLYIFSLLASVLLASSCSKTDPNILSPDGTRTVLRVASNLQAGLPATKAYDNVFDAGDVLITYIEAGQVGTENEFVAEDSNPFHGPHTFTLNSTVSMSPVAGGESSRIQETTDLGPVIYWDDFSSTEFDLRSTDPVRGIHLKYGVCYNGGSPSPDLTVVDGTFGWAVQTNQSSGIKTSDLLLAPSQKMIKYNRSARETLVLPFSHAMSKLTVEVICADGFDSSNDNLASTVLTFKGMNTSCSANATGASLSAFGTESDITALPVADGTTPKIKKSFTALIAPTVMKEGKVLAHIANVAGDSYDITLTDAILSAAKAGLSNPWSGKLANAGATSVNPETSSDYNVTNGGLTIPGVNYLLTVTVKKQEITVKATIANWDDVSAEGLGSIQFANDVTTTGEISGQLAQNGMDIYQKGGQYDSFTKTSHISYNTESGKWEYSPVIYWADGVTPYRFRALSGANGENPFTVTVGQDLLWGKSVNEDVSKGDLIAPRTGDVPLEFEHAMSKITVNLIDGGLNTENYINGTYPLLNLEGARIQIVNALNAGTLDIESGVIYANGDRGNLFTENETGLLANKLNNTEVSAEKAQKVSEYIVVPQHITDGMKMIITLMPSMGHGTGHGAGHGGSYGTTTYTFPLSFSDIKDWEKGKHYTYNITLTRQVIKLMTEIKDWEDVEGGGNANLDWD